MTTQNNRGWAAIGLALCINSSGLAAGPSLQPALQQAQDMLADGAQSQARINNARSETDQLLWQYRQLTKDLQRLIVNHQQVNEIQRQQQASLNELNLQLSQVTKTENDIVPMLFSLIDWLDHWVSNDLPFHSEERRERIKRLKQSIVAPDLSLSERYRQVMEAYQIESEFGYTLDTYAGEITLNNSARQVNLLRVGRVGLFYESLDGKQGGKWNAKNKAWQAVTDDDLRNIRLGILIALKQRPPALLVLPVAAH